MSILPPLSPPPHRTTTPSLPPSQLPRHHRNAADPSNLTALGRPEPPAQKAVSVFNALGAVAFAYSFSAVLLEVQSTLHEPPSATRTMWRAVGASLAVTFVAYVGVGFAGAAALGASTPGNVLTGFRKPPGLVAAANACVLVHMVRSARCIVCSGDGGVLWVVMVLRQGDMVLSLHGGEEGSCDSMHARSHACDTHACTHSSTTHACTPPPHSSPPIKSSVSRSST